MSKFITYLKTRFAFTNSKDNIVKKESETKLFYLLKNIKICLGTYSLFNLCILLHPDFIIFFFINFFSCLQRIKLLISQVKVNVVSLLLDIPGLRWPKLKKCSMGLLISAFWKSEIRRRYRRRKTSKCKEFYF